MEGKRLAFGKLCDQVRFSLDLATSARPIDRRFIADFVARISSTALRVRRSTVPSIYDSTNRVLSRLGIDIEPEVFVTNNEAANAVAICPGNTERLIVILNSGLVNLLEPDEIDFVLAHELGHYGMRHGPVDIDVPDQQASELAFLQEQSNRRFQEVSADRIGLLGSRSIDVAAKVIVKLASGLNDDMLQFDIKAFMDQLERDPDEMSRDWELDLSHPSLPLRLWALIQFNHSDLYNLLTDRGRYGNSIESVETVIEKRFATLGDGRIGDLEEECYSNAVLWSAMALIMHDNLIERNEQELLKNLVGEYLAEKAIEFARNHRKRGVHSKLLESLELLSVTSLTTKNRYCETATVFAEILDLELSQVVDLSELKLS